MKSKEVLIKSGKGSYAKDLLSIEVEFDDKKVSLASLFEDLLSKTSKLEEDNKQLRRELEQFKSESRRIDSAFETAAETMAGKIARLESKMEE